MKPVWLLLVLGLLLIPSPSRAYGRPDYIAKLRGVERVVSDGSRGSGVESRRAATRALSMLDEIERAGPVDTPAGQVRPYLTPVRDMLSKSPPELGRASEALRSLISALESPAPALGGASSRASLDEVFNDPRLAPNRLATWQERVGKAVLDFLRRIFGGLSLGRAGAEALSTAQVVVLVASLALVAAVVVFIIRTGRRHAKLSETAASGLAPPETSASLFVLAERYAQAGDYRQAVRANFVGLLMYLHEHGRLRYDRSLTNREHLSRIGRGTPLAGTLAPVVRVFDDVWYGNRKIDAHEYAAYEARAAAVRTADA